MPRDLPKGDLVDRLQDLGFPPPCYPNYGAPGSCPDRFTSCHIRSCSLRGLVTLHSVVSFFFNAAISRPHLIIKSVCYLTDNCSGLVAGPQNLAQRHLDLFASSCSVDCQLQRGRFSALGQNRDIPDARLYVCAELPFSKGRQSSLICKLVSMLLGL
jgi:hypothetical protein